MKCLRENNFLEDLLQNHTDSESLLTHRGMSRLFYGMSFIIVYVFLFYYTSPPPIKLNIALADSLYSKGAANVCGVRGCPTRTLRRTHRRHRGHAYSYIIVTD
jgi:hypothetical protein